MNLPLISIVLCTYNGERFLKIQMDSLLAQTYTNFELIISDDGSTDNTKNILQQYAADTRIKLIFQPANIGPEKNFEFALQQATGDFICCCDQDDYWMSDKIMQLYHAIGDAALVYCDSELVNDDGKAIGKKLSDLRNMYSGSQTKGFVFSNVVWGHALMFNSNILHQVLPIPASIPHDIWLAIRACTLGSIKYINVVLTQYRQHSNTVTSTISKKTTTRKKEQRYNDFIKKRDWIAILLQYASVSEKEFYSRFLSLYSQKERGKFVWPLLTFMLKHKKELFLFSKKSGSSQVIEIFKQCRGESLS